MPARSLRPRISGTSLPVLFAAFASAGVPKAIVSAGGGSFSCNQALDGYAARGIDKKRIDKRQAWQNYLETHFTSVRRMADAKFALATCWEQMMATHRKWLVDYNVQRHWAHEKRPDGCHSPAEVIGWHKGTRYPAEILDRILFATRSTRSLDKHGFVRFQHGKLYAEHGLAQEPVSVWVYEGALKMEYKAVLLSKSTVQLQEDRKHLREVSHPRLAEPPFHSPPLTLSDVAPHEWLRYWRLPSSARAQRKRRIEGTVQLPLFDLSPVEKVVGANELNQEQQPRAFLHLVAPSSTQPENPMP